ncbi:hypothetical protein DFJ43DRAFT_1043128 [Lentinula guzmanii]|uniref:Uncharacterized protein n=1 Tax=Lentinula guzmanii TaxID=2804957 RepID=A0AA38J3M2_9AGAR|nr:hypothetical protein DFJ43DRAFT_1043128 [Lentinula guzmanii]
MRIGPSTLSLVLSIYNRTYFKLPSTHNQKYTIDHATQNYNQAFVEVVDTKYGDLVNPNEKDIFYVQSEVPGSQSFQDSFFMRPMHTSSTFEGILRLTLGTVTSTMSAFCILSIQSWVYYVIRGGTKAGMRREAVELSSLKQKIST